MYMGVRCLRRFSRWNAELPAKPDDLIAAFHGKIPDMRLFLRQSQLGLEPEICLFPAHKTVLPQTLEGIMCFDPLAAQFRASQCPHRQPGFPMSGNISIADGIMSADIERRIWIFRSLAVHKRCRTQKSPGTTVGTFDIDRFHENASLFYKIVVSALLPKKG